MNMRALIFSMLVLVTIGAFAQTEHRKDSLKQEDMQKFLSKEGDEGHGIYVHQSDSTDYDLRVMKYRKHWAGLIPTQFIVQNAGNMGYISLGMGWNYGEHNQWETNLLFGFLPKYRSTRGKPTMTIKQNYIPWSIYLKEGWALEPLSCGVYFNTVFGDEFWGRQPERYPHEYYEMLSTKLRANIFIGQRVTKIVPYNKRKTIKSITAFYEISTCDIYLRSMIVDKHLNIWDIVGLSLGLKLQLL